LNLQKSPAGCQPLPPDDGPEGSLFPSTDLGRSYKANENVRSF